MYTKKYCLDSDTGQCEYGAASHLIAGEIEMAIQVKK